MTFTSSVDTQRKTSRTKFIEVCIILNYCIVAYGHVIQFDYGSPAGFKKNVGYHLDALIKTSEYAREKSLSMMMIGVCDNKIYKIIRFHLV